MREEHVPRHLARELRARLLHARLDQRVADLPHLDLATGGRELVVHRLRALHLADELRAWDLGEEGLAEQDHELVAPQDAALAVDRADAVRVAVERDTDL